MYNLYGMDKYEYEERYGERPIYCKVHHCSDIDYCSICEQEEKETEGVDGNHEVGE